MKRIFFLFLFLSSIQLFAQDPEFSMYYNNPLYLNPAFAGATKSQRVVINHRNQWPNIPITYQTYSASWDVNIPDLKSGFGVLLQADQAGTVNVKSTQFNLQYAYKYPLSDSWVFSTGLNFGIGRRSIDFSKLLFGDQLSFLSQNTPPPSLDPALFNLRNVNYFDFGAGFLIYNKDIWFGISGSHLNQPNRSFLNENANLPIKVSIHGGLKYEMKNINFAWNKKMYIMPSFAYFAQAQFDQLNLGLQFLYDPISFGVWYRGIPIRQNIIDNINQDAIVIVLGFVQLKQMDIFYSYDANVSELGSTVSGGSHELSIRYQFNYDLWRSIHKKKQKYIPCPAF